MATAFIAGSAVDARMVRAAGPMASRPRVQALSFTSAARGVPLVQRVAEVRAQRAAVRVQAAYGDKDNEDEYESDGFQERVVQVRRVTKVVKGGKQLRFRAVVSWARNRGW